jgi:hypothetical protein
MEAKKKAWLRLKASSEEFELWGKSWRDKDSKRPCLCIWSLFYVYVLKIKDWLTCGETTCGAWLQRLGRSSFTSACLRTSKS